LLSRFGLSRFFDSLPEGKYVVIDEISSKSRLRFSQAIRSCSEAKDPKRGSIFGSAIRQIPPIIDLYEGNMAGQNSLKGCNRRNAYPSRRRVCDGTGRGGRREDRPLVGALCRGVFRPRQSPPEGRPDQHRRRDRSSRNSVVIVIGIAPDGVRGPPPPTWRCSAIALRDNGQGRDHV